MDSMISRGWSRQTEISLGLSIEEQTACCCLHRSSVRYHFLVAIDREVEVEGWMRVETVGEISMLLPVQRTSVSVRVQLSWKLVRSR
ncbi:hypothetical protein PC119_g20585 [Phytophthora cactorum]|uniref:Uncharacterized protein n=1 Tax=Phytophthora cactorum TaxID=29920 RepID=A0A8T1BFZ1_9STRA|nr:hypothetical protein PC117_g21349 [Phytophthora cactorum]KAG2983482.1 hypothetical protein PC119_g20585 [Phytophthora cactorum]KAG3006930.1 hypothetical protein PC120_g17080 [Phytophthora cactorum]KAG3072731.1 hypothetical protein PC122_g15123 [Phytophthora cactorum]